MKYLITGGCGFLGSNIAAEVLKGGNELLIFDNLTRLGSYQNLEWLKGQGDFRFVHGDVRITNDVDNVIKDFKPDVLYHLAGQVAMTTSISNPRLDFEVNVIGSFNVLNAVRRFSKESIVVYSSTNKVYGDLENYSYNETETRFECLDFKNGFDENVPLDFHSPYGTSKGSADQYMLDFHRIYDVKTVVFRHSSMYGGRQFATFDQGWLGWFTTKALEIESNTLREGFTISGSGKQVRDLLFASDMVKLYLKVPKVAETFGNAFNIGGGMKNSCSLLELFVLLEEKLGIVMSYEKLPPRESDQKVFVADITKAKNIIGWEPNVSKEQGVAYMIDWLKPTVMD